MTRAHVNDLGMPYSLTTMVPGFMQQDSMVTRIMAAFDDLFAPAVSVLDCLDAYVDPRVAPDDFLEWLGDWVGAKLDDHWPEARRRESVLGAVALHRVRGTAEGLRVAVQRACGAGVTVEVVEPGLTTWSSNPTEDEDEEASRVLVVRVLTSDPESVRVSALEELIEATKPAHLPHLLEVVPS